MAPGEGLEPSTSSSRPGVLPVTPSRNETISGHWDSNPEPCADLALTPFIRRLLYRLSYAPEKWSRWKDLNRHRSIINRVLWPLSYTAMGLCTKSVFAEDISRAKAQRRKALPRFQRFSLRLCAFAPLREEYSCHRCALSLLCKAVPPVFLN